MSKDQQAPGALEQVRAFINTRDLDEGTDQLGTPRDLLAWLQERGLAGPSTLATERDLANALVLREGLRAIALAHNDGREIAPAAARALDEAARRARLMLRFAEADSGTLEPEAAGVDASLGRLLAIIHESIAQGTWQRLKACRLHSCEWAFYDHTKNHSGAWCNMEVCGNRAKARAYRARRGAQK